jgi:antibiotic biosynthesis monooxygenase (ABM) superfamily enzyme
MFPLTIVVPWRLAPLFGVMTAWALPVLGKLCVAVVIVALMAYVIMPRYTKLIARWLFDWGRRLSPRL